MTSERNIAEADPPNVADEDTAFVTKVIAYAARFGVALDQRPGESRAAFAERAWAELVGPPPAEKH